MRLGKNQLWLLATMASPFSLLVVSDKVADSLAGKGLIAPRGPATEKHPDGGLLAITPAGLRAVAEALESGHLEQFYDPRFTGDRVRIYISGKKATATK